MKIESRYWYLAILAGFLLLGGCSPAAIEIPSLPPTIERQLDPTNTILLPTDVPTPEPTETAVILTEEAALDPLKTSGVKSAVPTSQAEVVSVSVSGEPGAFNFSVTVSSPDEGCNQYADWWEIIRQDRELIYRRILLHSHVDEQPFTRSGGPVPIEADTVVLVRAHMHPEGYGSLVMKGSPGQGFEPFEVSPDFAANLSETPPLPEGCNF